RRYGESRAMKIEELAAANGIPANYLVQILIELKARNIVRSLRGKEGGYLLARPPRSITLGEVLRCIHGPMFETSSAESGSYPPELRDAWKRIQEGMDQLTDSIHFEKLVEEGAAKRSMYYI
ncbi:MAG: Rrf2 family transcriptional regulator, partial [Verrucomicrobia bacterium]|nr:Rrf2 family transcriptional regulator [Verrucomicrobiota bacterium]